MAPALSSSSSTSSTPAAATAAITDAVGGGGGGGGGGGDSSSSSPSPSSILPLDHTPSSPPHKASKIHPDSHAAHNHNHRSSAAAAEDADHHHPHNPPHPPSSSQQPTAASAPAETTNPVLWRSPRAGASSISAFRAFVLARYPDAPIAPATANSTDADLDDDYVPLYNWSVDHVDRFWGCVWDFCKVVADVVDGGGDGEERFVVKGDLDRCDVGAVEWFGGYRINYAENLLREYPNDDTLTAAVALTEDATLPPVTMTRTSLRQTVHAVASALRARYPSLAPGDRVAAYLPNTAPTLVLLLAAASLGLVWSSVSPELGAPAVLQRIHQIAPKLLFATDAVVYNHKRFDLREKVSAVVEGLRDSLEGVVVVATPAAAWDALADPSLPNPCSYYDLAATPPPPGPPVYARMPFSHPLFILYSSGTTGTPKGIVHSGAGALLQHLKEHMIQAAVGPGHKMLYYTTTTWMMYQWHVSSLATGATLVLYDGAPLPRNEPARLWNLVDALDISHFGASARYLQACQDAGIPAATPAAEQQQQEQPQQERFRSLLHLYATGSPLLPPQYDWIYATIKANLLVGSITGGTDILSLFAGVNDEGLVRRGELQCPGLGMAIASYVLDTPTTSSSSSSSDSTTPTARPAPPGTPGDLVCLRPFPVMPVAFFNDDPLTHAKYRAAYFSVVPGLWWHGDYLSYPVQGKGLVMLGRSDGTLKPGGVRFGSAELYQALQQGLDGAGIADALAVGQPFAGDERVVLFVRMAKGYAFDEALVARIRARIRDALSPRHVPAVILPIADIPYTQTGKKVELAVKHVLAGRGRDVSRAALANPESIALYEALVAPGGVLHVVAA